jgi:3-deoxy-D-manno-octulosonic-acid transferase
MWSVCAYMLGPYALLRLIWRGLRYPAYWRRWPERWGFVRPLAPARVLWVHAVSVGEVRSVAGLIRALRERYPRHTVLVTTMTPTGGDQVRRLFGDSVRYAYLPFDFPGSVGRFLARIRPDFAVIAETEFWPNLLAACARNGIPVCMVNTRLSVSSARAYMWAPKTMRRMFRSTALMCAQTRNDAQRLRNLGAPESRVCVTGNLKFDAGVADGLIERARRLRTAWGQRPTLIAGSTHRGEERQLLAAFAELRQLLPDLLLVLVPRHPERFSSVIRLARNRGFGAVSRSVIGDRDLPADADVYVGDTMGELQMLYAAADIAFVGGSLARRGGQNLLEACAVGVPVIFGPHMFNFEEISAMALEAGAGCQIQDRDELVAAVARYFGSRELRTAASQAGLRLVAQNRGALLRTLDAMGEALRREKWRFAGSSRPGVTDGLHGTDQDRA